MATEEVQFLIDRTEERIFSLSENHIGEGFPGFRTRNG